MRKSNKRDEFNFFFVALFRLVQSAQKATLQGGNTAEHLLGRMCRKYLERALKLPTKKSYFKHFLSFYLISFY